MTIAYRVTLEPDDNGTLLVTCRSLPEVTTFGDSEADALRHARAAIEEALAARIADGEEIPKASGHGPHLIRLAAPTSLNVDLYRQMRRRRLRGGYR
jgi:antitoxin HicB